MQMQPLTEEQIDKIMKNFDFTRVRSCMEMLDWQWAGEGIPTVDSIRSTGEELLRDLGKNGCESMRTGGLHAYFTDTKGSACLVFELERADCHVYSEENPYHDD